MNVMKMRCGESIKTAWLGTRFKVMYKVKGIVRYAEPKTLNLFDYR